MKQLLLLIACTGLLLTPVFAEEAELYHTLAEKKAAGLGTLLGGRVSLSGLVEIEAGLETVEDTTGQSDSASDLVLATAQLGIGVEIAEGLSADLILLYEEDDTDLEFDEVALNFSQGPYRMRIGQQYLPFGGYPSHFVSDPLTLELGETRETALLLGYNRDWFDLSLFVFNGDAEKVDSEDHIRDWGASLALTPVEALELGVSYLSDLADSDAELLFDELANPDNLFSKRVGAWSAYLVAHIGAVELSGEYLAAERSFSSADLDADGDGDGDLPRAWNLELAWHPAAALELAARYEGSDELFGQPERQYGLCASWGVRDNLSLSLEYLRGDFDRAFGDGADRRDLVTAQLGVEF